LTFPAGFCLNLRMDEGSQLPGRFLPSKVYARWKWTVRFGLFAVPLILFLAGGFVLYLEPAQFESKAVFEYHGSRTPAEAAALLKSRNVQVDVCDALELNKQLDVGKETVVEALSEATETHLDPVTGLIEVRVIHARKELARDVAAGLVKALDRYETTLSRNVINSRLQALRLAIRNGEDKAEARRKDLLQLIAVRGEAPADPASKLDITASRIEWEQECRRVADNKNRAAEMDLELASLGKFTTIHTDPVISQTPAGKKSEDSLGELSLESLGYGLLFALLVPYLFELACPFHRRRIKLPVRKAVATGLTDEWSTPRKPSDLVPSGLNG
jgi:hypothetical protein